MISRSFVFYFRALALCLLFQLAITSNSQGNQCPPHLPYRTPVGCTSKCPDNAYINGSACVPDCGNMFVTTDRRCANTCKEGYLVRETITLIGKDFYREKLCVSGCLPNEIIYNGSCVHTCPISARSIDVDRCFEICPAHKTFYQQITIQNISYKKCLTDCDGLYLDGMQCVSSCKEDHFMDNSTCVAKCPIARKYIKDKRCVKECPNGTLHIINNTCISHCFPDEPYVNNGTCIQKCPHYSRLEKQLMHCAARCQNDEYEDDRVCKDACPDNKVIYNRSCVQACPEESLFLYEMKCLSKCPGNMVNFAQNNSCLDKCPPGMFLYNKGCLKECPPNQPFMCQESYRYNGGNVEMLNLSNEHNWNMACKTRCPPSKVIHNKTCLFSCPHDLVQFDTECFGSCPKYLLVQNSTVLFDTDSFFRFSRIMKKCVPVCDDNKVEYSNSCFDACPNPEMVVINKRCHDRCHDQFSLKQQVEVKSGLSRYECVRSCKKEYVIFNKTCLKKCPNDYVYVVGGICRVEECRNNRLVTNKGIECVDKCPKHMFLRNISCVDRCLTNETVADRVCLKKCPVEKPFICQVNDNYPCGSQTDGPISKGSIVYSLYTRGLDNSYFECVETCPGNMLRQNQKCVYFCEDNYFMLNKLCVQDCPLSFYNISLFKKMTVKIYKNKYYDFYPDDHASKTYRQCELQCNNGEVIFNSECISKCPETYPFIYNGVCQKQLCTTKYGYKTYAGFMCVNSCTEQMFGYHGYCLHACPNGLIGYLQGCVKECPLSHGLVNISTENSIYKLECVNHCESPKVIFDSTCIDMCPPFTYKNNIECKHECPHNNSFACQETDSEKCGRRLYQSNRYHWHNVCRTNCPSSMVVYNKTCLFFCPDDMTEFNGTCYSGCPKLFLVQNTTVTFLKDDSRVSMKTKKCVKACGEYEVVYNYTCFKTCPMPLMVEFNKECFFKCPDHHPLKKPTVITYDIIRYKCVVSCDMKDVISDQTCVKSCPKDKIYFVKGKCSGEICVNYQLKTDKSIECVDKCPENMLMRNRTCVSNCFPDEIVHNRTCLDNCPKHIPFKCIVTEKHACGEWMLGNIVHSSVINSYNLRYSHIACVSNCPDNMFQFENRCEYFCPENLFLQDQECVTSCSMFNGMTLWKPKTIILSNGNDYQERIVKLCKRACHLKDVIFNSTCISKCPDSAPFIYNGVCQKQHCKTEYSYHINAGVICVDSCPEKMFAHQGICWHACPRSLYGYLQECVEKCPLSDSFTDISSEHGLKIIECVRECDSSKVLFNSTCMDSCPFLTSALNGSCISECKMPYGLQQYNAEKNQHECVLMCNSETVLNGNMCTTNCPDYRFVLNKMCVAKCPKAHPFTQKTNFGIECLTSCKEPKVQHNYSCRDDCPQNFRYLANNECVSSCPDLLPIYIKSVYYPKHWDFKCVSSCPSYEYRFQNTCVTECPDQNYKLDGKCVEKCPPSKPLLVLDSNSCDDSCSYNKVVFNGTCIITENCTVPNVLHGKECLAECPNGLIWLTLTRTCQLIWVSYTITGICFFGTLFIIAICWRTFKDTFSIECIIFYFVRDRNTLEHYEVFPENDSDDNLSENQEEIPMLPID